MLKKIFGLSLILGFTTIVFGGDGTLPLKMKGQANGKTVEVAIDRISSLGRTSGNGPCGTGNYLRATGTLSVDSANYSIQGVCSGTTSQILANDAQLTGSVKNEGNSRVFVGTLKTGDGTLPLKLREM